MKRVTHAHRTKEGFFTNTKGITSETIPLFIALLLVSVIAVVLLNAENIGFVASGAIQHPRTPVNTIPPSTPSVSIHTNVGEIVGNEFDAVGPTPVTLFIRRVPGLHLQSGTLSIDGIPFSSETRIESTPTELAVTFPAADLRAIQENNGQSARFVITTNIGTLDVTFPIETDRTPPRIEWGGTFAQMAADDEIVFTIRDAESALTPRIEVRVTEPNGYTPTRVNFSDHCFSFGSRIECEIPYSLSAGQNILVQTTDRHGNAIIESFPQAWGGIAEDVMRAERIATAAQYNLRANEETDDIAYFSGQAIQFDIFVMHVHDNTTLEMDNAGWTANDKIHNTVTAVNSAMQLINTAIAPYEYEPITYTIGRKVLLYHNTNETITEATEQIDIGDVLPGTFETYSCDNPYGVCIFRQDITPEIGYPSEAYTAARRIETVEQAFAPNWFTGQKTAVTLPIVIIDNMPQLSGYHDTINGVLYIDYLSFIDPLLHTFRDELYARTLAHELAHGFGAGHSDDIGDSLMYPNVSGMGAELSDSIAGRVRANFDNFRPASQGIHVPNLQYYESTYTDCGPQDFGGKKGKLLDEYEGCEEPYSGNPNAQELLTKPVEETYCPATQRYNPTTLEIEYLDTPIPVGSDNIGNVISQDPFVLVRQCVQNTCACGTLAYAPGASLFDRGGGGVWRGDTTPPGGPGAGPATGGYGGNPGPSTGDPCWMKEPLYTGTCGFNETCPEPVYVCPTDGKCPAGSTCSIEGDGCLCKPTETNGETIIIDGNPPLEQ